MDLIHNLWRRHGGYWEAILSPLTLLSWVYSGAVRLRLFLYKRGIFKTRHANCPVISIGNLTVGGTGKTPMVLLLAEYLSQRGDGVGIVSRGYRRRNRSALVPVSDGKHLLAEPEEAGDEPYLMAQRLPHVPVVVAADRYLGCQWLIERCGVNVILLDDGFQHVALHRDLNILLWLDPISDCLLPRGPLREPLLEMQRADILIRMDHKASKPSSWRGPILQGQVEPVVLVHVMTGRLVSWDRNPLHRVYAFCGIAAPERFFEMLSRRSIEVVGQTLFRDHHRYTLKDITALQKQSNGLPVITTEKDAVKLRAMRLHTSEVTVEPWDLWALRIDAHFIEPAWEHILFDRRDRWGKR